VYTITATSKRKDYNDDKNRYQKARLTPGKRATAVCV